MQVESVFLIRLSAEDQRRLADLGLLTMDQALGGQGFIEHRLPAHSGEASEFQERLMEQGLEFYVREERHFSRKEIRGAHALRVGAHVAVEKNVSDRSTEYDWSACCGRCMRVPQQTGHLTIPWEELVGRTFLKGGRGELIVNEHIALRMIKEDVSGCLLREVRSPVADRGESEDRYYQVIPTRTLPNTVSPPTRFVVSEDHCDTCGLGGLHLDSLLYYDLPVDELQDVNVTLEIFGEGAGISPEIVVSPRFYNLLISCGAELSEPEPVMFV